MTTIHFQVLGPPIAQPRPRVGLRNGRPRVYKDESHPVHAWRQQVQLVARQAYRGLPLSGPLHVELAFVLPRPCYLTWKRKPMPRVHCAVKPDADNLAKAVLDACRELWEDDAQVAELAVSKWIAAGGEQPGVEVVVRTLEDVA